MSAKTSDNKVGSHRLLPIVVHSDKVAAEDPLERERKFPGVFFLFLFFSFFFSRQIAGVMKNGQKPHSADIIVSHMHIWCRRVRCSLTRVLEGWLF